MDRFLGSLRHGVRERLEFIEFRLYWENRINRRDLTNTFRISPQQASSDLARYIELAPENLIYDSTAKTYIRGDAFKPVVYRPSARRYLSTLRLLGDDILEPHMSWLDARPSFAIVPLLQRRTPPEILRPVTDAIRQKHAVRILYRSLANPEPDWRWIEPHALAFDGRRWHVRAWCQSRKEFRDFVIARIDSLEGVKKCEIDSQLDLEWHRKFELHIIPSPALNAAQKSLLETEYSMRDGVLTLEIRIALAFYIIEYLRLDEKGTAARPARHQLHLSNAAELSIEKDKARRDSATLTGSFR